MMITRQWTDAELQQLRLLRSKGASPLRAAAALKRNIKSVQRQARLSGAPFPSLRAARKSLQSAHSEGGRSSLSTQFRATPSIGSSASQRSQV